MKQQGDGEQPDFRDKTSSEADLSLEAAATSFLTSTENGQSIADWANDNPDLEYRLWLMTRPDNKDLRKLARKRLQRSERTRVTRRIAIGGAALYAAGINGAFIATAVTERNLAYALWTIPAVVLWGPAVDYARTSYQQLPQVDEMITREQYNFRNVFSDE